MKKNFKRTLAKVMAVALTVSMVGVASTDADAAKKIKLSSKSISVAKGATKKVTIKNVKAKKVKKLTVKSKNKKIATVKKAGKTAFKVTGKKAGKSTKVTVKVKVGKKTTKLTLKVKVTKAKKVVVTAAPATTAPTAAPAASASATPAANASTKPATTPSAKPVATPSATPDEATPAPTEPVQPEPPTTEAKKLPELNLRREAATEWTLGGEYGTAIFNTDDTISYSSYAWAKKAGDCYNNGIAWYIDPAKKGKVDLSAYTDLELTIKTDAEIKFMTWGGSADAASFWDKNDNWGAASKTVENADGSKTITYNLEKIFGSATKVKKAVAVGLTLKSDKDGDDSGFSARTATIFVNNGGAGTDTNNTDTNNTDTNNVDTNNVDTNNTDKPEPTKAPIPEVAGEKVNVKTSYDAAFSDNDITELEDGNIKLNLSGKNNRVWFKLGEEIDLNDYSAIKVVFANAPQQMTISVFEGSETKGDNWWNNAVANAYPCYGGSASKRSEDGGVAVRGPEVGTIDLTGKTFTSKGGFITVAPNAVTGIASDAVLNEDGDLDFAKNDFTIASIVLVKK
mgnify:CR=1 FL=1